MSKTHVLLVEDAPSISKALRHFFNVDVCNTYEEACTTIEELTIKFDVNADKLFVVLDRNLQHPQGKSGVDIFIQLHEAFSRESMYLVNFSSDPEEFIRDINTINPEPKNFDVVVSTKNARQCKTLFDQYVEANVTLVLDDGKNAAINNTYNSESPDDLKPIVEVSIEDKVDLSTKKKPSIILESAPEVGCSFCWRFFSRNKTIADVAEVATNAHMAY